ncbi:hypothetical protein BD413DRAFT_515596 [Trametes elegans]|nr:hypothetical protein BD413DRAFT_515596 [Trametes elegans]
MMLRSVAESGVGGGRCSRHQSWTGRRSARWHTLLEAHSPSRYSLSRSFVHHDACYLASAS